jgi:protein-L-isoaspartate(D-aspartate) O-methyltransferase
MGRRTSEANRQMVRRQIAGRGIRSARVLGAFLRVDRIHFVPAGGREVAYGDHPVSIGAGQTVSQPYMVALMLDHLRLRRGLSVLEVGSGSGYALALLWAAGARPFGVEWNPALLAAARENLRAAGVPALPLRAGDGALGWPEKAPFDRILVSAACPAPPPPLLDQLAPGGLFLAPVTDEEGQVLLRLWKEGEGRFRTETLERCVFVPLKGPFGLSE